MPEPDIPDAPTPDAPTPDVSVPDVAEHGTPASGGDASIQDPTVFFEHRRVPMWWWAVIAFFVFSAGFATWWYLGPRDAALLTVGVGAIVGWIVIVWGRSPVRVDADALGVGPNRVEWKWTGAATALDREETTRLLGPDADPRAFLQTRPWLHEAVRLDLDDPADPHPYWLIGTRDATALCAAIDAARTTQKPDALHPDDARADDTRTDDLPQEPR